MCRMFFQRPRNQPNNRTKLATTWQNIPDNGVCCVLHFSPVSFQAPQLPTVNKLPLLGQLGTSLSQVTCFFRCWLNVYNMSGTWQHFKDTSQVGGKLNIVCQCDEALNTRVCEFIWLQVARGKLVTGLAVTSCFEWKTHSVKFVSVCLNHVFGQWGLKDFKQCAIFYAEIIFCAFLLRLSN